MIIQVPMEVSRAKIHPEGFASVWGHVGDYEVMITLKLEDAMKKGLFPEYFQPTKKEVRRYGRR